MKKFAIIAAFLALTALPSLFALDAEVVTVNGKVEYQNAAGAWKALTAGETLTAGTMISTGFKSEATVKLGASILTVKALTRMTLTQLVEKEDTVDTELYLEVGNVKAEVNSFNNKKNAFSVKSPVATASVRGTVFEIGDNLVVTQGTVVFSTPIGQSRRSTAGQQIELFGEAVSSPAAAKKQQMQTIVLTDTPSAEVTSPVIATITTPAPVIPQVTAATPVPKLDTFVVLGIQ